MTAYCWVSGHCFFLSLNVQNVSHVFGYLKNKKRAKKHVFSSFLPFFNFLPRGFLWQLIAFLLGVYLLLCWCSSSLSLCLSISPSPYVKLLSPLPDKHCCVRRKSHSTRIIRNLLTAISCPKPGSEGITSWQRSKKGVQLLCFTCCFLQYVPSL